VVAFAAVAVVVVAGAAVGVVLLVRGPTAASGGTRPGPAPSTSASASPVAAAPVAPRTQLDAAVQTDRSAVERVVGQWVPQIGSKAVGTQADGTVYDEAAILADYRRAKARFPAAVLLRSDDYMSFKRGGFWVVVVATPFASAAAANSWCDAQGLGPDGCFAKRLSHADGPTGNTMPR
jgi:hypothetical protein